MLKLCNHLWEFSPVTSTSVFFFPLSVCAKNGYNSLSLPFLEVVVCLSKGGLLSFHISPPEFLLMNFIWSFAVWVYFVLCAWQPHVWHDGVPEPLPAYSSRVGWYCLPWSIVINYIVVSESASENQAHKSSSWSILSDYTPNAASA